MGMLIQTIADRRERERKKWSMKRNWKRQIKRLYFMIKRECVVCEMHKKNPKKIGACKPKFIVLEMEVESLLFPFRKGIYIYIPYWSCLSLSPIIHGMDTIISICAQKLLYECCVIVMPWHSSGDGEWEYAWTSITAFDYYDDGDGDDDDVDLFQRLACRHEIQHRN